MGIRFDRSQSMNYKAAADGQEAGACTFSLSSEEPYERWFGIEILSHDAAAVDLSRLSDGRHPLLLNHCTDDQIGVIDKAWIDSEAKALRCDARFSRSACAQEIRQDVEDGIRSLVSVGYFVDEIVEVEPPLEADDIGDMSKWKPVRSFTGEEFTAQMRAQHGDTWNRSGPAAARAQSAEPPVYLVTRWTPFEGSIVPIPADPTVGIGRSAGADPVAAPAAHTPTPSVIVLEKKAMENVKSPAEIEAENKLRIISLGTQYAKYLGANDVADWVRSGKPADQFVEFIMEKMAARHTDTSAIHVGLNAQEVRRYSLGRALRAATLGDWREAGLERECSEAVAKIMGRDPEGFYLPPDVFRRDFNVGTSSEAGNLVPTQLRDDLYVDVLRNNLVVGKLGVRILAGLTANVDLPRKSVASTIGSNTEIGSASETNPNTAKVTLSPKRLTAYVQVSKQALIQSAMALEPMIRDDLMTGAAVQIENNFFNGVGSNSQPLGIRNTTGIGTVAMGANAGTVAWSTFVDLESAVANANAEPDAFSGYVINTKTRGAAKKVQKATNLPFLWDGGDFPLNGYRAAVTNNLPSNLTKGTSTTVCSAATFGSDWSMAVVGLFGAPDLTVDPYSLAANGHVQITLNQFHDVGVRQPGAFAKVEDLLT